MNRQLHPRRAVAILMLGVLATSMVAPVAEAGNGRGHDRRYKRGPVVREVRYSSPFHAGPGATYVRRQSNAGPVLAGILGGIVLGAAISNAQPAAQFGYSYWDPYCEDSYVSLSSYGSHIRRRDHPTVVRVIETRSGNYVRDLSWRDNAWREYQGDWRSNDWRGGDYGDVRTQDIDRRYQDVRDWNDD